MPDILDQKIGAEGEAKVYFSGGDLVIEGDYNGQQMSSQVINKIHSDLVFAALEKSFPNPVVVAALEFMRGAVKVLPQA